jgi:hypothetical protein
MPELLQIPLNAGASEHTDAKLFPAGALKRVENLRLRKNNRLGKRFGWAATSFQDYGGSTPVAGKVIRALIDLDGAGRIVADQSVYDYNPESGKVRALDNGLPPYAAAETIRFYNDEQTSQDFPDLVDAGDYYVACWVSYSSGAADGTLYVAWIRKDTKSVVRVNGVASGVDWARLAVAGSTVAVFWVDNTLDDLLGAVITLTSGAFPGATTIATNVNTSTNFDAAGLSSFCVAYHSATPDITVKFLDTSLTTLDTRNIARSGNPGVVADGGGRFYVLDNTSGQVFATVYNSSGGASIASATVDAGSETVGQVTGCADPSSSTQINVVWSGVTSGGNANRWIKWRPLTSSGTFPSSERKSYGTVLASKPWTRGTSAPTVHAWTAVRTTGGSGNDAPIFMARQVDSTTLNLIAGWTARGLATNYSGSQPSHLPGTAAGAWAMSVLVRDVFGGNAVELCLLPDAGSDVLPTAVWQHTAYIGGGVLSQADQNAVLSTGFLNLPVIRSGSNSAGVLTGDYSWVAVWERTDGSGKVHRSEPSAPTSTVSLSSQQRTLLIEPYAFENWSTLTNPSTRSGATVLRVYRTLAGGTVFYETTPPSGMPVAVDTLQDGIISYTDNNSDASIRDNTPLYTQVGNSLPHSAPPGSEHLALHNDRLWAATPGGVLKTSKVLVENEPPQWADDPTFDVRLPGECTGIVSLDAVLMAFTAGGVFAIGGDGPDDAGEGFFVEPQRVPSDSGGRTARSIVAAAEGAYYASVRGMELLPRGGGSPLWVGEPIRDTLATYPYVGGAMVVPDENVVSFVVSNDAEFDGGTTRVLSYDYRVGQWFIDSVGLGALSWCSNWLGTPRLWSLGSLALYTRSAGFADGSAYITSTLETGDMTPFGPLGWGRVSRVAVLGEYRGDCTLQLELSYDGGLTWTTPVTWNLRAADGLAAGAEIRREIVPARWKTEKLRVRLSDLEYTGSGATEGFVYTALAFEVESAAQATKQPSASRR